MSNTKSYIKKISYIISVFMLMFVFYPSVVSASQITGRSVVIGSSVANASTTYSFNFTVPSSSVIKSASFTACDTPNGACVTPAGFSASTSSLASQPTNLGDASGWTVDTADSGALRLNKTGNVATPFTDQTVDFANVTNPNLDNLTFYIRIETFLNDDWTGLIDSGVIATSTASQVQATAIVDETLNFEISDSVVNLGTLTKVTTGTGTSTMTAGTNAQLGYSINYDGPTLTSGGNTIDAMSTLDASVQNSKQFGMNLTANTTPVIGSTVTGTGVGTPSVAYNTADQFKFNTSGEVVATSATSTNDNIYTVSYVANIDSSTAPGVYTSAITYTITANF